MDRRQFIRAGAVLGLATPAFEQGVAAVIPATPKESEGPFYPVSAQTDKDFDLTGTEGKTGTAQGNQIFISGEVLDTNGKAIEGQRILRMSGKVRRRIL